MENLCCWLKKKKSTTDFDKAQQKLVLRFPFFWYVRQSSASLFIHQTDEWVRENEKETTIKITPSLLLVVSAIEILVYLFWQIYMWIETYIGLHTHICDSPTQIALS